jgi:hypothetical protein
MLVDAAGYVPIICEELENVQLLWLFGGGVQVGF